LRAGDRKRVAKNAQVRPEKKNEERFKEGVLGGPVQKGGEGKRNVACGARINSTGIQTPKSSLVGKATQGGTGKENRLQTTKRGRYHKHLRKKGPKEGKRRFSIYEGGGG